MPVERPTFSESWYRVADLRPRLRSTVQTHRQHFRGQTWHVVQDPSSNQFFRLNEEAYRFVAMLDGRRTVADVWHVGNEQMGDRAPTQGEAIQLLGQLYAANLLQGDLPPDAESLLRRYRQRQTREIQGFLTNFLFIRVPLLDPDGFLERFVGFFGRLFSWYGLAAWALVMAAGGYALVGRFDKLLERAPQVLDPESLPLLYLSFILIKVVHEFCHAFACKKFGRESGSGGEVHVMGVMFLVFTPLPYVDASSSWAFRRKGHRVVVGGAGMWVELAAAAVAALVWAGTREGTTVHVIAYNVLFVGSVSTLLFNANPLLRYDGYYILSDLIEIPNLAQRSRDFLSYLVRRYAWGVRHVRSPAHTRGEGVWLLVYALASTVYRVFISVAILLFISSKLPFIGAVLALAAVVAWLLVPLGRFVHYLAASTELARVRARAVLVSAVAVAAVAAPLGLLPLSDPVYVEGVVEPREMAIVHAGADGFLTSYLASGMRMSPEGEPLVRSANPTLAAERRQLAADRRQLEARRNLAQTEEPAAVQILDEQIQALAEKTRRLDEQLAALRVRAPLEGLWFAPDLDQRQGAYLRRGDAIGLAATLEDLVVRAVAGQDVAGRLRTEAAERVVMRVVMRPDLETGGTVRQFLPAGRRRLPSPALGYAAGGPIAVTAEDRTGTQAAERFFEIHVSPDPAGPWRLFVGQRVVIRFETQPKPLLLQGWRWVLQLLQRRFQV